MPRRRGRRKAEGGVSGVPQPAKSEDAKETDESSERATPRLPPKAVLDALPEQVRTSRR